MKKFLLTLGVMTVALTLAACGGGSGGGDKIPGGEGPGGEGPGYSLSPEDVFVLGRATFDNLNTDPPQNGVYSISKTTDGIRVQTSGTSADRTVELSAPEGDFRLTASGDYFTATKKTTGNMSGGYSGRYEASYTVLMAGKTMGLQHSDFGAWGMSVELYPGGSPSPASSQHEQSFLVMGDANKKAHFSGSSGRVSFSGKTLASFDGQLIDGNINLTIDTDGFYSSKVKLAFPNFYYFDMPIAVGADGSITKAAGTVTYGSNGGTIPPDKAITGVYRDGNSFNGQFYGNAPDNPSEAVGGYSITTYNENPGTQPDTVRILKGSYGVKK